jgi:hypothetical protein
MGRVLVVAPEAPEALSVEWSAGSLPEQILPVPLASLPPSANTGQRAQTLVREAEAACNLGDTALASEKALAALDVIKQ